MEHKSGGSILTTTSQAFSSTDGASPVLVSTDQVVTSRNTWSMDREVTPFFNQRKREGALLPFNYYNKFTVVGSYNSQYAYSLLNPPHSFVWWRTNTGVLPPNGIIAVDGTYLVSEYLPDIENLVQSAAAKIYSKGYDGLTFLGELGQTISMFQQIGKSLLTLLSLKDPAGSWMLGRYGVRTLVFDIQSMIEAINNLDDKRKRFKESSRSAAYATATTLLPWNWSTSSGNVQRIDTISIDGVGHVLADIEPPKVRFNIAATAWELATLSFVIDWWISVGQWIEAMSFLAFSTGYTAGLGYRVQVTSDYNVKNWTKGSATGLTINSCSVSSTVVSTTLTRWPVNVPLGIKLNRKPLNALKMLDIASIVKQVLSKKFAFLR